MLRNIELLKQPYGSILVFTAKFGIGYERAFLPCKLDTPIKVVFSADLPVALQPNKTDVEINTIYNNGMMLVRCMNLVNKLPIAHLLDVTFASKTGSCTKQTVKQLAALLDIFKGLQ